MQITEKPSCLLPSRYRMVFPSDDPIDRGYLAFEKLLDWFGVPHWGEDVELVEDSVCYGCEYTVYYWTDAWKNRDIMMVWDTKNFTFERERNEDESKS